MTRRTVILARQIGILSGIAAMTAWSCLAQPASAPAPGPTIEFDHAERNTLHFKSTGASIRPITLDLFEAQYLGTLRAPDGKTPYFLFRGKTCDDCPQDPSIHVVRPGVGKVATFVYPGRIVDSRHRQVVLESRAFFGRCLRNHGEAYVVFQKERVDKRPKPQQSVFLAEAGADHLEEQLMERRLPRIQDTLHYVKLKSCHEIEGRNRIPSTRRITIPAASDEDEETDDTPKENQTDKDLVPPTT